MRIAPLLVLLGSLLLPSTASALAQTQHKSISITACTAAGLPADFCDEVGAAAYNVDLYEWDLLAAHAQPEEGQSQCDAAYAVTSRVQSLAKELRTLLQTPGVTISAESLRSIALAFGRTLHTLQDNCAHSGMPNIEHAWFSLSDACLNTQSSPDLQPEATQCAEQETKVAFEAFVAAYQQASLFPGDFLMYKESTDLAPNFWPPRGGVCDFLKGAGSWDGQDRRWNNAVVVPALESQLYTSLVVDPGAPPLDLCATNPDAIALEPAPPVDVSQKMGWCTSIQLYCSGKADGLDSKPPWETGAATTTPASSGASEGGCTVQPATPAGSWPTALLAALGLALGRSRRRVGRTVGR
jgi:MYXO-CTERM domain-containing protein